MLRVHLLQVRAHLQQYTLEAQAEQTPDGQKAVLLRQDSKVGVVYQQQSGRHTGQQPAPLHAHLLDVGQA